MSYGFTALIAVLLVGLLVTVGGAVKLCSGVTSSCHIPGLSSILSSVWHFWVPKANLASFGCAFLSPLLPTYHLRSPHLSSSLFLFQPFSFCTPLFCPCYPIFVPCRQFLVLFTSPSHFILFSTAYAHGCLCKSSHCALCFPGYPGIPRLCCRDLSSFCHILGRPDHLPDLRWPGRDRCCHHPHRTLRSQEPCREAENRVMCCGLLIVYYYYML